MEMVENFIIAARGGKGKLIHTTLPFKDFVILLDLLFDLGFKVEEISKDSFNHYFNNSDCDTYHIDKETLKKALDRIGKK